MPHAYPLMLDVTNRRVVIVGGGEVAARKARGILEAGPAKIRVVSPEFAAAIPHAAERIQKCYDASDLQDADLVFAATNSAAVNDAVVADATSAGIWVCRADGSDELPGDFTTPAKFQQGSVLVTVSAGSAALSVRIRDGIETQFDPAWSAMADAMVALRPMVLASKMDTIARRNLFRELVGDEAMKVLAATGLEGLTRWVEIRLKQNDAGV